MGIQKVGAILHCWVSLEGVLQSLKQDQGLLKPVVLSSWEKNLFLLQDLDRY